MSSSIRLTVLSLLIVKLGLHVANGSLQCKCDKSRCIEPKGCRSGVRFDACGCCMVCAKEEGQSCGGPRHIEGECGDKMQCVIRRFQGDRMLVGRCEYVECHYKMCPFGHSCTLVNNIATCVCPLCKDMKKGPMCGIRDKKQYNNECELRLDECITGTEIEADDGVCKEQDPITVVCDKESMRIEVSKSYLGTRNGKNHFRLLDAKCKMHENKTHIYKNVHFNECMTRVSNTSSLIIYSNSIKISSLLSAMTYMEIPFQCKYPSRKAGHRDSMKSSNTFREIGKTVDKPSDNKASVMMVEKLRDNSTPVNVAGRLPLRRKHRSVNSRYMVDVNHVETYLIEMQSKSFANYKALLSPTFCYASPIEKSQQWMKYIFIRRGCPIEDGVQILAAESPLIRMTVPSIKFRAARYPGILVRCRIRACFPKNPSDKDLCESHCPTSNHVRRRKDLSSQSENRVILKYEMAHGHVKQ